VQRPGLVACEREIDARVVPSPLCVALVVARLRGDLRTPYCTIPITA
jgi:hypothetical protein